MVIIAKKPTKKTTTTKSKKKPVSKPKPEKEKTVSKPKPKKDKFVVGQHILVPKHSKLSQKEKIVLLEKYKISLNELPRISMKDSAIEHLELTNEDVIKIERSSPTSKNTVFYRRVVK